MKKQIEILDLKNTIINLKSCWINSRLEMSEERPSICEERSIEMIQFEKQRKNIKKKKKDDRLRNLWNNSKRSNVHVIAVSKEKKSGAEKLFEEKLAKNFEIWQKT